MSGNYVVSIATPFISERGRQRYRFRHVMPLYYVQIVHPLFTICVISPINTLPDPGIEPEIPCLAVALATIRSKSQSYVA
ncbi:hypothetical protein SFRURICE_003195, partial [Spodoptera frugiperda]